MARITVRAVHGDGEPRRWTLSERIVAEQLDSELYATQLLDRLGWATADAEALESQSADLSADDHTVDGQPATTSRPAGESRRGSTSLAAGGRGFPT